MNIGVRAFATRYSLTRSANGLKKRNMRLRLSTITLRWSLRLKYSNSLSRRCPKVMLKYWNRRYAKCVKITPDSRESLRCSVTISSTCGKRGQESWSRKNQSLNRNLSSQLRIFMIKWKLRVSSWRSLVPKFTTSRYKWPMEQFRISQSNKLSINNRLRVSFQRQEARQELRLVSIKQQHQQYLIKFRAGIILALWMNFWINTKIKVM